MTENTQGSPVPETAWPEEESISLIEVANLLFARWRLLTAAPIAAGFLAIGISFLIPPTFTAKTVFLPPQQPQSAAATALASLGALSGFGGSALGGIKTTADQYVSLLKSVNVQDRIIDQFRLMEEYESEYRFLARKELSNNTRISLGKKDGLISLEVDAKRPQLAADIANQHVSELRRLTGELALTEAQQRRVFFEGELKRTREQLTQAQQALQQTGFNPGALKAEPKAAADSYARLKAEATAAEISLQTMQRSLAEAAPELQRQKTLLFALRNQLAKLEAADTESSAGAIADASYISRYREYKYQESLFELFSRQYEAARLDESRESGLIQVIDVATPPEHKSKPKRASIAIGVSAVAFLLISLGLIARRFWDSVKPGDSKATEQVL